MFVPIFVFTAEAMVSSQLPQNAAFSYDITCRVSVKSIVSAIRFDDVISFIFLATIQKT